MRLEPGSQVDRYTIEAIIGEGGMGRVCRAFDTRLRRRVALKVLHPAEGTESTDAVASALREARAAAAIAHPNATAVYDADELDGAPYIVMEFVPGTSLRQIISGPPVPLALRLRWLVDIAGALAAAHQVGIVHRDVKPENVMVREDGLVKVLDFGVARRTVSGSKTHDSRPGDSNSTPDGSGRLVGTPAYMPPEQIRGEPIDGRADQFAWSVLGYELLTGRLPWKTAREFLGYIAAVLTEKPDPPRTLNPDIPHAVDAALMRALAKNPANRFPNMTAAAGELIPYTQDAVTSSVLGPPSSVLGPPPASVDPPSPPQRPSPDRARPAAIGGDPAYPPPRSDAYAAPRAMPSPPSGDAFAPNRQPLIPGPPTNRPPTNRPPAPRAPASHEPTPPRSRLPAEHPLAFDARPSSRQISPPPPPPSVPADSAHEHGFRSRASDVTDLGTPVPPARSSAPAAQTMPSVRRSLPEGYHKLRDPHFDAPIDCEAHVALLPADATCKGMFFADLLRMGARAATPAELARAAQIPDRKYSTFRDYPAAENLRLTIAVARAVYPKLPVGEGLRRLGQTTFDSVLGTHMGRSILGILGPDIDKILLAAPKTFKHLVNFGRVTSEKAGAHTYFIRAREFPVFLETFGVGVIEGAFRHCRATGKVRVMLDDLSSGLAEVRLG